jgi:hypothetical protein
MEVYPDTKKDQMSVYISALSEGFHLFVFDAVGNKMLAQKVLENITYLDISSLETGIYFISLVNSREEVLAVKSFMKKRYF